jgi:hypothetical protein
MIHAQKLILINSGSFLEEFWVKYQPIYPEISNEAL